MAKANGQDTTAAAVQVLAVGLGRGFGGKSTSLAELVWRARNQGREVIVADGDPRSRTLVSMFPERTKPTGGLTTTKTELIQAIKLSDQGGASQISPAIAGAPCGGGSKAPHRQPAGGVDAGTCVLADDMANAASRPAAGPAEGIPAGPRGCSEGRWNWKGPTPEGAGPCL